MTNEQFAEEVIALRTRMLNAVNEGGNQANCEVYFMALVHLAASLIADISGDNKDQRALGLRAFVRDALVTFEQIDNASPERILQ